MKLPAITSALVVFSVLITSAISADIVEEIDETQARIEFARVLRAENQWNEAIENYRKVLAVQPENYEVAAELAQTLAWNKQPEAAEKILADIPEEHRTSAAIEVAIDIDIRENRMDAAEQKIRQLLAIAETDPLRFRLASVLSWTKKYDESTKIFADLVERNPSDVQLRRRYAQVLGWAGKSSEASEQWKRSLE